MTSPDTTTPSSLEQLAARLGEFERKYSNLMRNAVGLSPEGQGLGIALLTTLNMATIAEAAAALRSLAQKKDG